jgi:undecaprenyl-diphosphatase
MLGAVAGFLAAVPLTALALSVRTGVGPVPRLDLAAAEWAHDAVAPHPRLVQAAHLLSVALHPWVFRAAVLLLVLLLVRRGARRLAWWAGITMAVGSVLGVVLKMLVARARPVLETPLGTAPGYSFPSGHALNSMVGTLVVLLVVLPALRTKRARVAAWMAGGGLVLLTGLDRVALGVHFPSDVLAGWIAGVALTAATAAAFETWRRESGRAPSSPLDGVEPEASRALARSAHTSAGGMQNVRVEARRLLRVVALPGLLVYGTLVVCGLLLTRSLARVVSGEDAVVRALASHRSAGWSTATAVLSILASTPVVVGTVIVLMAALRLVYHRWREALMLLTAVLLQAVVFLSTTLVIDRTRPDVPRLDPAPPTSSFPSGHTGAATALYLALALVIGWRMRHTLQRVLVFALLAGVPIAVGAARLYRGMHHPSDVAFGALNGLACLAIAAHAFPRRDSGRNTRGDSRGQKNGRQSTDGGLSSGRAPADVGGVSSPEIRDRPRT